MQIKHVLGNQDFYLKSYKIKMGVQKDQRPLKTIQGHQSSEKDKRTPPSIPPHTSPYPRSSPKGRWASRSRWASGGWERLMPSQLLLVMESTSCVLIHSLFWVLNHLIHRRMSLNPSFWLLCWVWYSFCTEEILVKPELCLFFMVLEQARLTFGEYQRIRSAWFRFRDLPGNTGFLRNLEHC